MSDDNPTIFGKILRGEIPATVVYEDDRCMAFRDVNPAAPTHVLVIPRKHLATIDEMNEEDEGLIGHLVFVATRVARDEGLSESGYRLVMNCGAGGGQSVFHIHLHVIGGRQLSWPPG